MIIIIIIIIKHSEINNSNLANQQQQKKAVKLTEDANPVIQVIISGLIHQEDCEVNNEIASINNQLEYCNS